MASNKVMICPICGGVAIGKNYIFNFGFMALMNAFEEADNYYCWDCHREIIPLVTPQEVRNG